MVTTENKFKPKGGDTVTFKEGDWVRFYSNGTLVIGEVRYMHRPVRTGYRLVLSTDAGEVSADSVIEQRSLADYIKGDE